MIFMLFAKICILVTLTFALTRTRLFAHLLRPRPSVREQITPLFLFLLLGFAEVKIIGHPSPNLRIVAVCAAGLLTGPLVGGIIGLAVTAMACIHEGFPLPTIALSMVAAGLAGGWLHRWKPTFALRPATGFVLGASISLLRYALALAFFPFTHTYEPARPFPEECVLAFFQGSGVALILLVVALAREQEAQARAAAMAEVRALQARMNPHFLFNSLNTLSALSRTDPHAVPTAAASLGRFLRASLDQQDRPIVPLQEELAIVTAYLEIESLRMGERLSVFLEIKPDLLDTMVPPFLLQPLVENAVQHGIQPRATGGQIRCSAHREETCLVLEVSDNGIGIPPDIQARLFRPKDNCAHALPLLRRRLQGLYGNAFTLTLESVPGNGVTVTVRIPLQSSAQTFDTTFDTTAVVFTNAQEPATAATAQIIGRGA
jgi:two-component system LytT family sensor kinase